MHQKYNGSVFLMTVPYFQQQQETRNCIQLHMETIYENIDLFLHMEMPLSPFGTPDAENVNFASTTSYITTLKSTINEKKT